MSFIFYNVDMKSGVVYQYHIYPLDGDMFVFYIWIGNFRCTSFMFASSVLTQCHFSLEMIVIKNKLSNNQQLVNL